MINEKQVAMVEAVLFAAAEPIEYTKLASVLGMDDEQILLVMDELNNKYSADNCGICLLQLDTKYQLCSKKEFVEAVRDVLDLKRNTPLSQAALRFLRLLRIISRLQSHILNRFVALIAQVLLIPFVREVSLKKREGLRFPEDLFFMVQLQTF